MLVPTWTARRLWWGQLTNGLLLGALWLCQLLRLTWGPVQPIRTLGNLLVFTELAAVLLGLVSSRVVTGPHRLEILTDLNVVYQVYGLIDLVDPQALTVASLWDDKWGVGLVVTAFGVLAGYLSRAMPHYGLFGFSYQRLEYTARVGLARILVGLGVLVVLSGSWG